MINESKYDMRGFVLNQISSKNIGVDDAKVEQIIEQINAAIANASQYTDWEVKSNIHAGLKIRLRSILDKHQLPILDELCEEVLSRAKSTAGSPKSFWFVGASYGKGSEDQTERFLNDGVWQNGYQDKYLDVVRSMQQGDKIAIKSSYTRKQELPFDNKDQTVSVMGIKAIGVITRNHGDGRFVDVEWQPRFEPVNEWYFYTNRSTIWRVSPDDWMTEGLIDFTFNNKPQDIDRFRNAPYWKERFGDTPVDKKRFKWTRFYEEFADKLLAYKDDRAALMAAIHDLPNKTESISVLQDQPEEGTRALLDDICPFTVFSLFNRGITDAKRISIANELAAFLEVEMPVPNSFEGIPVANNQCPWFFGYKYRRGEHDIDTLWNLFEAAIEHANNAETDTAEALYDAYGTATKCWGTGWNLSMGLYWIRPWKYLTLDGESQTYITKKLGLAIGKNGEKDRCSSKDYFGLIDDLETRFQEDAYPVHSFPELSLSALQYSLTSSVFEQHVEKFKLAFPDFHDFNDSGNRYKTIERNYKMEAIKEFQALTKKLTPDCDNAVEILSQTIELANFFNWRDKQHIQKLSSSEHFSAGIVALFRALKNKQFDQQAFNSLSQNLLAAETKADYEKDRKLAANMFLQLIVFIPFLFYPEKYFAMKSSKLRSLMKKYDIEPFERGSYISYEEFIQIQRFGKKVKNLLQDYQPNDYVDVQSFLWVAENFDQDQDVESTNIMDDEVLSVEEDEVVVQTVPIEPYTIDDIIADGCFLERESIAKIITQLRHKKNLILQGPPGTGKTWLAKKLAYALMGQKDENSLRAVQFHPNLSYEDFVRGWRPSGEGKLTLVDGPFLEIVDQAKKDANIKRVIVIEEINRGNPAQIFGEMLTLLEADKRTPSEALELSYRREKSEKDHIPEKVHIPANLYIIGTMNIADRSLALVDLALRRRFAFFDLKPTLGEAWRNWVHSKAGIDNEFLQLIEQRIVSLNNEISKDRNLGPQFKIGHSYVTPPLNTKIEDASAWFHGVVETEIGPLLEEYWFDDIDHAIKSKDTLVEGI